MTRTTITLDDELLAKLRRLAAQRHVSVSTLVREAVEEKLKTQRPRLSFLGVGASGHKDTARKSAEGLTDIDAWR